MITTRHKRQALVNHYAQQNKPLDGQPFVLFLRSFQDDDYSGLGDSSPVLEKLRASTLEQEMVASITSARLAPLFKRTEVIAVGNPGEELPPLGCIRYTFPHDSWHREVEQLMDNAVAVLLRPGTTPAVLWETARAVSRLRPQRFYLLANTPGYGAWREEATKHFSHPLPPAPEAPAILGFDSNWSPTSGPNKNLRVEFNIPWMLGRCFEAGVLGFTP
jgi:hypothetical protein